MEKSKKYKNLIKSKEEKQKIVNELDDHKEIIIHSFSILERALRKYSKIAVDDEKLVLAYLEKPIITLRKDNELRILKILDTVESSILNNTIELKDAKGKKTIEEIKKMNRNYFESFLSKYNDLKDKITELDKKMLSSAIEEKKEKNEKELEKKKKEKEELEKTIEDIKKEIEKINIEEKKKKIEDEIEKAMNIKLIIS